MRIAVETYHRDWRLLQEPLQNAIDSFIDQETGKAINFETNHKPTVSIIFDIDKDLVTVKDNGSGIKKTDHRYLIDPYKGGKEIRGAGSENDTKKK